MRSAAPKIHTPAWCLLSIYRSVGREIPKASQVLPMASRWLTGWLRLNVRPGQAISSKQCNRNAFALYIYWMTGRRRLNGGASLRTTTSTNEKRNILKITVYLRVFFVFVSICHGYGTRLRCMFARHDEPHGTELLALGNSSQASFSFALASRVRNVIYLSANDSFSLRRWWISRKYITSQNCY